MLSGFTVHDAIAQSVNDSPEKPKKLVTAKLSSLGGRSGAGSNGGTLWKTTGLGGRRPNAERERRPLKPTVGPQAAYSQ